MTETVRRIATIATGQLGAFTRTQAHDAGLSDRQLRSRVQSGFLIKTGSNTFRVAGAPTTTRGELTELMLDLGAAAWCCGPTAAALHGFDGMTLRRPFHVLLPRHRSVNRWNVRTHRTDTLPLIDQATIDGLRVTSAARTLIDMARLLPSDELAACVDSALRDGLISEDLLHRRIIGLRSKGRYGLPLLQSVLAGWEVTRGGHSWLEREYLRLLGASGLPRPEMQQVLTRAGDRLVRVDCRFPGTRVVVELLGYEFHRSKAAMARDAEHANALLLEGFRPFQFTYGHVVAEPQWVIDTTLRALLADAA